MEYSRVEKKSVKGKGDTEEEESLLQVSSMLLMESDPKKEESYS